MVFSHKRYAGSGAQNLTNMEGAAVRGVQLDIFNALRVFCFPALSLARHY
jgi:hypothetical protein